jgi:hypothetical protein
LPGCCAVDPAEEDAAYDEMLVERRTLIAKLEAGESEDDDLAGMLNGDWTDDEEIETALNNVDVFNMLVAAMNNMKSNEPERFHVRCLHQSSAAHNTQGYGCDVKTVFTLCNVLPTSTVSRVQQGHILAAAQYGWC